MLLALSTQIKSVEDNLKSFIALAPATYFENFGAKEVKAFLKTKSIELLRKTKLRMILANTKKTSKIFY